jgi:hypothetical protein
MTSYFGNYSSAATFINGITIATAVANLSVYPVGTIVFTNGHTTANDGGACELTVVSGTQTVNGVLVFASTGGKSLVRAQTGKPITAKSCGLKLDGVTDDTVALQNAVDVIGGLEHGALHFLPTGALGIVTCRITNTIYVRSTVGGFQLKAGGGGCIGNSNVIVLWQGASDKPAFTVSTFGALFEGFAVTVSTGYTLNQAFDLTNAIGFCSRNTWKNIRVYALGTGTLVNGWTTNHYRVNTRVGAVDGLDYASGVSNANCEDMVFDGVCVAGWTHSAFRQSDSQPYNWLWNACKFEQNGLPTQARGVVHWCDSTSATGASHGCFYYNIEVAIYAGGESFKISSPSSELVKKWYYSPYTGYTNEIYLDIGRNASDGYANTSSGPFGFSSTDVDYITAGGAAAITLAGFQTRLGASSAGRILLSYGASLTAFGCVFPNSFWITKGADPEDGTVRGGIYTHSCKAMNSSGIAAELGEYRGACSPSMTVQLDNFSASTITIPLERDETDIRYTVNATLTVISGTYTGRIERISNKTKSQFTVELSSAPSAASVVISCEISYAPSSRQKKALAGASDFTETTVLRSTSGGTTGPSVSSNFCLEFLVAMKTPIASLTSTNADNSGIASRGYTFSTGGWDFTFVYTGGQWQWQFRVGNNTSTTLLSPVYTDAELNKIQHFVVRGTGGVLTLFRQGIPIASLTTAVVQSNGEFCIGNNLSNPTLLEDKHVIIYSVAASSTAPTDGEILARYEATKALEAIPASWSGHTQTHRYLVDGRATITNDAAGNADPLTLRLVSDGSLTTSNPPTITATVAKFF